MTTEKKTGLELLRQPFPASQISKLPKPTKAQTDAVKQDYKVGIRCQICGAWHHPQVVHLDYVGHAALTNRLLESDENWNWEPMATNNGAPALDANGGMWIRLNVCGVTRIGYGHAEGKTGGDAIKEVIGDALRNAAMRFGAALDLWHKGDLPLNDSADDDQPQKQKSWEEMTADERLVAQKAKHDAALAKHQESVDFIKERIAADDLQAVADEWAAIPMDDQMALWLATSKGGIFTTEERKTIKEKLPRATEKAA